MATHRVGCPTTPRRLAKAPPSWRVSMATTTRRAQRRAPFFRRACHFAHSQRPCGLMDKALVFGTKDCRFESCQGHSRLAASQRAAVALATRVRGLAPGTARRGVSARESSERLRVCGRDGATTTVATTRQQQPPRPRARRVGRARRMLTRPSCELAGARDRTTGHRALDDVVVARSGNSTSHSSNNNKQQGQRSTATRRNRTQGTTDQQKQ
jgi:hypothetical protein